MLRSAPPRPRHRPPGTPRRRNLCVMTYRHKKLRSAPPGPRHRPPGAPRPRQLCVMTYRRKKLWSAPPGHRHRPPGTPRRGPLYVITYRRKKLRCAPPEPCHQSNISLSERSILTYFANCSVQNRTIDKININVLLWTHLRSKNFSPFRTEHLDFERFLSERSILTLFANCYV